MAGGQWHSDEALFEELREAVTAPDVERMREAAKAAFTWRTVDADLELLALSYDSLLDPATLVRGDAAAARTLVFESESFTVCVEVGSEVLTGQLVPARPGHLTLLCPTGWCGETESDDAGFFLLARPRPGPVRLRCRTGPDGLLTDWVVL